LDYSALCSAKQDLWLYTRLFRDPKFERPDTSALNSTFTRLNDKESRFKTAIFIETYNHFETKKVKELHIFATLKKLFRKEM
jgi:hypothetical protein